MYSATTVPFSGMSRLRFCSPVPPTMSPRTSDELIRDLGPTGLVMNPGCEIPFNAKPENVRAMVEATREFGTFA